MKIKIIDRKKNILEEEMIYGEKGLTFLYKESFFSKILLFLLCRFSLFSRIYGFLQKKTFSKKKIKPFIEKYNINVNEFEKKIEQFTSFNDFFIRKLKKDSREFSEDEKTAILPADGRYLVFPKINEVNAFYIKGEKFSLRSFLKDDNLFAKYKDGAMVIARLAPVDYHRFHFPFSTKASKAKLINGYYYSVNPIALKTNLNIFSENKRMLTELQSKDFGDVLFIEIGATNVGTIHQTFSPKREQKKGDEKGYFSFGGSSIVLIFQKGSISFDDDLVENTKRKLETKAFFGMNLGTALNEFYFKNVKKL